MVSIIYEDANEKKHDCVTVNSTKLVRAPLRLTIWETLALAIRNAYPNSEMAQEEIRQIDIIDENKHFYVIHTVDHRIYFARKVIDDIYAVNGDNSGFGFFCDGDLHVITDKEHIIFWIEKDGVVLSQPKSCSSDGYYYLII